MLRKLFVFSLFLILFGIVTQAQPDNNRFMLAQNFVQIGEYKRAAEILESLYKQQPDNLPVFDLLNQVYIQLKEYSKSETILTNRINKNQGDISAVAQLGKTYFLSGNPEKTKLLFEENLTKNPTNVGFFRLFSNVYLELRSFDDAIQLLQRGSVASGNPDMFSMEIAYLYSITMRYTEAAELYANTLRARSPNSSLLEGRILQYIDKPDALEATYRVFVKEILRDNREYLNIMINLCILKGDFPLTKELVLEIESLERVPGYSTLIYADRLLDLQRYNEANLLLIQFAESYTESTYLPQIQFTMAKTGELIVLSGLDSVDSWKPMKIATTPPTAIVQKSIESYQLIANKFRGQEFAAESLLRIARLEQLSGNPASAEQHLNELLQLYPMSKHASEAVSLGALLFIEQAQYSKATRILEQGFKLRNLTPQDTVEFRFYSALNDLFQGNIESARIQLASISNASASDQTNDALLLSMALNPQLADSLTLIKFGNATKLVFQKQYDAALELFAELSSVENAYIVRQISEIKVVEILVALNRYETALSTIDDIVKRNTNIYADEAAFLAGKIYLFGLSNPSEALKQFERLFINYPNSMFLEQARTLISDSKKIKTRNS